MGIFKKNSGKEEDAQVKFYDAATRQSGGNAVPAITVDGISKETVNLCKREKRGVSPAIFCLIFACVMALLLLIEFFGVYRPVRALEAQEAQLTEARATLSELNNSMSDWDAVREEYRKYNYENFPSELVDREDVLQLLEDTVFARGRISNFSMSGNTLDLTISDILSSDIDTMMDDINNNKLVDRTNRSWVRGPDNKAAVAITIWFVDATKGGD